MSDEYDLPLPPIPSMITDRDEDDNTKDLNDEQETKLATVKMLLESIGQTVTVAFPLLAPINELITHFAKELRMPANILQITFKGMIIEINILFMFVFFVLEKVLDNQLTLSQIEVEPNTTVSMGNYQKTLFYLFTKFSFRITFKRSNQ
jgi:hypothetical protein